MSLRSLSKRLSRLEGGEQRYLWRIDLATFPGKTEAQAIEIVGQGRMPGPDDVVMIINGKSRKPPSIIPYFDFLLFGDREGRDVGQVFLDEIADEPSSHLDSLLKP